MSTLPAFYGRFESEPDQIGEILEFTWLCGSNEHGRFFADIKTFVAQARTLSRGVAPANCYLIDEDYCFGEMATPLKAQRLLRICELIELLEKLSLIPDNSTHSEQPKSLIFVMPAGDGQPPKTLQLVTQVNATCLEAETPNISILRDLMSADQSHTLHGQEYRSLYRLAIADALVRAPNEDVRFQYLVEHWAEVVQKYEYDVDCFIKNFSFDKLRLEIVRNSLEFSSKLTTVMGDNTGKFLALPAPLLALAAIVQTKSIMQADLLLLSALAVAVVFSGTTKNQFIQLYQVEGGFKSAFEKLLRPDSTISPPIKAEIDGAVQSFDRQHELLKRVLWILRIGAWVPPVVGLLIIVLRFYPPARLWLPSLPF